jgi:hypothetical protein
MVAGAAFLAWYVAGHWNRWTGAARYESTDDAYTFGDLTPLSAKVSGYVETVAVNDYQSVRKGTSSSRSNLPTIAQPSSRRKRAWPRRKRSSPISETRKTSSAP